MQDVTPFSVQDVTPFLLIYTLITVPIHGTLSGIIPNLVYTPDTDYYGADSFSFIVNDGKTNSNIASVNINVTNTITPGDIDDDEAVSLKDAILVLQILSGNAPSHIVYKESDLNGDGKLGIEEVIYILQKVSGLR